MEVSKGKTLPLALASIESRENPPYRSELFPLTGTTTLLSSNPEAPSHIPRAPK